jgi:hypothetical protein
MFMQENYSTSKRSVTILRCLNLAFHTRNITRPTLVSKLAASSGMQKQVSAGKVGLRENHAMQVVRYFGLVYCFPKDMRLCQNVLKHFVGFRHSLGFKCIFVKPRHADLRIAIFRKFIQAERCK